MIIFWSIMLVLACGVGAINLYWVHRVISRPIRALPWWIPLAGFIVAIIPVTLAIWNLRTLG